MYRNLAMNILKIELSSTILSVLVAQDLMIVRLRSLVNLYLLFIANMCFLLLILYPTLVQNNDSIFSPSSWWLLGSCLLLFILTVLYTSDVRALSSVTIFVKLSHLVSLKLNV